MWSGGPGSQREGCSLVSTSIHLLKNTVHVGACSLQDPGQQGACWDLAMTLWGFPGELASEGL